MKSKLVGILPYVFVFTASLFRPWDPDLGWHLKYGEYFFQHGQVLKENTFSQMMPHYIWPNVSWGTDVITYAIFKPFGFFGLTIFAAVVITATVFFFSKWAGLRPLEQAFIFPFLLYLENPVNSVSFRGQLLSLLFVGVLFFIFKMYEGKHKKIIYLTVPLLLLWNNIHGQFILGFVFFGMWIVFRSMRLLFLEKIPLRDQKKELTILFGLFFTALAGTLVFNPFGIRIYEDILHQISSKDLQSITEWLPFDTGSALWWNHVFISIFFLAGATALFFQDKFQKKLEFFLIIGIIFFLSFWVRRYAWPLYYISLPLLQPIVLYFKPSEKKEYTTLSIILTVLLIFFVSKQKLPFSQFPTMSWNTYCSVYMKCSPASANYLVSHKQQGKILTLYDWGGYLIWNYPQIKPTIDGRMHIWRDERGYSAFSEYFAIEHNQTDIDKTDYTVAYVSPQKPIYKKLLQLVKSGKWDILYQDTNSGLFQKRQ